MRTEKVQHLVNFIAGIQLIASKAHQRKAPIVSTNYKMTRLLIIFTLITLHLTALGQKDFGLKANFSLCYFSAKFFPTEFPQPMQTFFFMPSGQAGLFYNLHFSRQSVFGADLLFNQIEGKQHYESPALDNLGNPTGQYITSDMLRHISYLSIPIYYSYNYKRISINGGFQTSFALASSGYVKIQGPDGTGGTIVYDLKRDKLEIKDCDFGAKAGFSFALTNKIAIQGSYYYGLLNIYKYYPDEFKYKIQQLTIGVQYKFISISK